MDYEFDTKKKNVPYGLCHKLIDKKQITLPPKALQYLPALMVDKD